MSRASRYAVSVALLFGFLGFVPMRSALLSVVNAAPGLSLLRGRTVGSSTDLPPARHGMPLLDRLLRRPSLGGSPGGPSPFGLRFDGVDDRVTFGPALPLGSPTFTLETWFMREGAGVATSTGTGGVLTAVPLVTKGRAEAEGSNVDMNYFLGIDVTSQVLVADFEDTINGGNHPVIGTTRIWPGVWYHAAATYDGTTWKLYLNGNLDQTLVGAFTPRADSIQHAGLGTAFNSTGVAAGFFKGQMDEARIWNFARSQADIQSTMGVPVTSGTGLLGRWGLDEGTGTVTANSIVTSPTTNGTLAPAAAPPTWVAGGSPFAASPSPGPYGLHLGGTPATNDFVSMGAAPGLNAATFTLETWFKRDGTGVSTSTGTGGITAVPLVTKGRAEAEASNVDMNYFLRHQPVTLSWQPTSKKACLRADRRG